MLFEPVEVDQGEPGRAGRRNVAAWIEKKVAEIEVFVEHAGAVEGCDDSCHFDDNTSLEESEAGAIEAAGEAVATR